MKSILISFSLLLIALPSASQAASYKRHVHHHYVHHVHHYVHSEAMAMAVTPAPTMGSISAENRKAYLDNLRASGYDPKNDYNKAGAMRAE
jgi:hypothetical protein